MHVLHERPLSLKAVGVPEEVAEVHAQALAEIVEERLATKRDIKELEEATKRDLKAYCSLPHGLCSMLHQGRL